ncbi:MAG TPA: RNA polymerase sigma factor [Longimicrobiales bacterium]
MVSGRVFQFRTDAPEDDVALVARARDGDRDAQDRLLRRYLPEVHALTRRLLHDPELAADAAQDALVNALTGLSGFRGDASFRTWILRIAANAAHSAGRRRGRRREVDLDGVEETAGSEPDPYHTAAARIEAERATRMLQKLPPKQRLAVTLRVSHGLSYAEASQVMKCSEGAARVNYHLGIRKLRELLA